MTLHLGWNNVHRKQPSVLQDITALPPKGGACTKLGKGEEELNELVKSKTAEIHSRNRRSRTDKEKREEDMAEKDMTTEGPVDTKPGQAEWKVGECWEVRFSFKKTAAKYSCVFLHWIKKKNDF